MLEKMKCNLKKVNFDFMGNEKGEEIFINISICETSTTDTFVLFLSNGFRPSYKKIEVEMDRTQLLCLYESLKDTIENKEFFDNFLDHNITKNG